MFWIATAIVITALLTAMVVWYICSGTNQIDRLLLHGRRQIWVLMAIIAVVLILLVSVEHILSRDKDDHDSIFFLYGLFSQTVSVYQGQEPLWKQIYYLLASLTGTILFSGVFIATVTNSLLRRIENSRSGRTRYSRLRNHDVVIGAGEILIPSLIFLARDNRNGKLVIVTNENVDDVYHRLSELNEDVSKRVIIYKSDISTTDYLHYLCLDRCRSVVILGDGQSTDSDAANVAVLKRLHGYVKSLRRKDVFHCYVSYSDDNMLLNYCCNDKYADVGFRIYPFNFYAQWSDRIWGYGQLYSRLYRKAGESAHSSFTPLRPVKDDAEYSLHVVVAGFGPMAAELVKTAVKVAHFANYDETTHRGKTLISVISDDTAALNRFTARYGNLSEIPDVDCEYIDCDINSRECFDRLSRWAASEHDRLYVAICSENMNDNAMLANNMPSDIYKYAVPTLVYLNHYTDAVDCLFGRRLRDCADMKIFGAYNSYVDLCGSLKEAISLKYICKHVKRGEVSERLSQSEAAAEWYMTHWDNIRRRWMATINALYNMIDSAGMRFVVKDAQADADAVSEFAEAVAPIYQRQYIAWNILAGYTAGEIGNDSEWLLRRVNTLHELSALKAHSKDNAAIEQHIADIENACEGILVWLSCNKVELKRE